MAESFEQLKRRLAAARRAADEAYRQDRPIVPGGSLIPGATSGAVDDEEEEKSWSSQDPNFYGLRDIMVDIVGVDIGDAAAGRVLNQYGATFYETNSRWPTLMDLRGDEDLFTRIVGAALRTDLLPAYFAVDGPEGRIYYDNTTGVPRTLGPAQPGDLRGDMRRAEKYTVFSQDEFEAYVNIDALGGTSGGSGGSGRGGQAYDKAQIGEYIDRQWGSLMLETAPNGLVDRYVSDHTAFWREGGSLDLETWVLGEMRKTGRYQALYGRKDPSLSEGQYLGQYTNLARGTGLRGDLVNREAARGAAGGVAPQSFANSLVENRDVQALGTGDLSRRFAQTVARIPA